MLRHMRASFDLPDPLLDRARALARRRNKTLRDLVEAGLLRILEDEDNEEQPYTLPDLSFGGDGLDSEVASGGWDAVRALAYGERGG